MPADFQNVNKPEIISEAVARKRKAQQILAEGEWDGIERLWINSKLVNQADTTLVHFHPGVDGILGSGLAATSTGGDQGVDAFFSLLPSNFQRETFSRKVYLALNVPPDPSAPSATLDVIGDFRCSKVRQFDASGNQTAYSFSTNGAWQALDAILRAYLKPEWNPSAAAAAGGDLTAAEKARISFPDVFAAAQACDFLLPTGQKRFSSSVAFVNQISLADALTQICNISQLFVHEVADKIYIRADQQRASTFILTKDHILAGKMSFDKKDLHAAKNRIICNYRDVNPQDSADIETPANNGLVRAANVVTVKTKAVHPYLVGDSVNVLPPLDGSVHDTSFDGLQLVASVPSTTTWTYAQTAANATSGNGYTGTPESRFAQSTIQMDHENHQKSIGQRGLNLSASFRVSPVTIDLGNSTEEQVKRTATFMKNRVLGLDQTPYIAPFAGTLSCYLDAVDANGNSLIKQICGDIITVDATVSEEYQGDYEIKQMVYNLPGADGGQRGSGPTIDLTLLQYLSAAIADGTFLAQALSASVPRTGLPPSLITDNLILNGDFEQGLANWGKSDVWGGGISNIGVVVASDATRGGNALIVTPAALSQSPMSQQPIPVDVSKIYLAELWVKSPAPLTGGAAIYAGFNEYDVNKSPLVHNGGGTLFFPLANGILSTTGNGWQYFVAEISGNSATPSANQFNSSSRFVKAQLLLNWSAGTPQAVEVLGFRLSEVGAGGLRAVKAVDPVGRLLGTFRNNPVNCNGQFTGGNPLSQSGATNTILVAASSIRFGDGAVSYNSGSVNPGSLGKWYVYADDVAFTGGAVTYQATSDVSVLNGGNGRVCFGVITTTSGGSVVGTGSGGGGAGGVKLPQ